MKLLDIAWVLAIGIDLGALMVFLFNKYTPTLSTFIIWAVLIMMTVILTLCTMQVRMMEPRKKKLPVRRASRVAKARMKVVR